MPKPKNAIPTERINITLPIDVYTALQTFLFSEAEQRVPQGAYQQFFVGRIREFFSHRHVDLAPLTGSPPGAFWVSGTPEAVEQLVNAFKEKV